MAKIGIKIMMYPSATRALSHCMKTKVISLYFSNSVVVKFQKILNLTEINQLLQ